MSYGHNGVLWPDPFALGSAWFQMGSYFGSSLCAVDLNADGLSDLLVGAPMHSEIRDEGQVSVYLSRGNVSSNCPTSGHGKLRVIVILPRVMFYEHDIKQSFYFIHNYLSCSDCLFVCLGSDGRNWDFEGWQCLQWPLWGMHCISWRHWWWWVPRSVSWISLHLIYKSVKQWINSCQFC